MDKVTDEDAVGLYDTAMTLSRTAFAGGHYGVAYHALAAALHAAYDLGDDARLATVGEVGEEQRQWLDEHDPDNALAARAAATRGSADVWATLRLEVQTRRRMLEHRRTIPPEHRLAD